MIPMKSTKIIKCSKILQNYKKKLSLDCLFWQLYEFVLVHFVCIGWRLWFVFSIAVAKVDVLDEGSLGAAFAGSAVVVSALGYPKHTVEVTTLPNFLEYISVEYYVLDHVLSFF
jgi:hypothetical protein